MSDQILALPIAVRVLGMSATVTIPGGGDVTLAPPTDAPSIASFAAFFRGVNGASAYELAVAAGFVGSEAAWLASLSGDPAPSRVFVQQTRPTEPGPWMWWQTDALGAVIELTLNTGD